MSRPILVTRGKKKKKTANGLFSRSELVQLPHAHSGAVFPFRAAVFAFQDHTSSPSTFAPLRVSSLSTEQLQVVPSTIYPNSIYASHKGNGRLPKDKLLSEIIACLVYPAEHHVGSLVEPRLVSQVESCEEHTEGSRVEPRVETEEESYQKRTVSLALNHAWKIMRSPAWNLGRNYA